MLRKLSDNDLRHLLRKKILAITIAFDNLRVTDADLFAPAYPKGYTLKVFPGDHYTLVDATVTPENNFVGILTVPVQVNDGEFDSKTFNLTAGDPRRALARLLRDARRAGRLPDHDAAGLRPDRDRVASCDRTYLRLATQVSPRVEEAARALGRPAPRRCFGRSRRRWFEAESLAGAALVFLHAIQELPGYAHPRPDRLSQPWLRRSGTRRPLASTRPARSPR